MEGKRAVSKTEIGFYVLFIVTLGCMWAYYDFQNPYEIPKNDCDNICLESNGDGSYSIKKNNQNISHEERYCNIKNCEQSKGENNG